MCSSFLLPRRSPRPLDDVHARVGVDGVAHLANGQGEGGLLEGFLQQHNDIKLLLFMPKLTMEDVSLAASLKGQHKRRGMTLR